MFVGSSKEAVRYLLEDTGGHLDGIVELTGYPNSIERAFYTLNQVQQYSEI